MNNHIWTTPGVGGDDTRSSIEVQRTAVKFAALCALALAVALLLAVML